MLYWHQAIYFIRDSKNKENISSSKLCKIPQQRYLCLQVCSQQTVLLQLHLNLLPTQVRELTWVNDRTVFSDMTFFCLCTCHSFGQFFVFTVKQLSSSSRCLNLSALIASKCPKNTSVFLFRT